MSDRDRKRLKEIHTFPALVKYLREDLGWPVEQGNFADLDEITFDWEADELGIDPDQAAKIEYIKQLRPLENGEPQGVFFVKFNAKSLPVVALRRLLSKLVIKKRATATAAERPLWAMRDLVFISSYGSSDERQLSFAYFQESEQKTELPTLKVLGWDDRDTALHLDRVHDLLTSHLTWPANSRLLPLWRKDWSKAFELRHGQVVSTAKELAEQLATLARGIRARANQLLKLETAHGPLRTLMSGFKTALIHDLEDDQFADMYAQTIAYGLLSARITHPDPVKAETLADLIPVTNPFLKELMETFVSAGGKHRSRKSGVHLDFDELGINDVVELLRRANMDAVLRNFGAGQRKEDPVTYFYEDFLNAYDAQERKRRGVYYTPKPVVLYIVRSVHELLKTEFQIKEGLASTATWGEIARRDKSLSIPSGISPNSPFVRILDPATGTATFLVTVIEVIFETLTAQWKNEGLSETAQVEAWNSYVPKHLLPRLYGFELMMAPYAIAHLKIGLKLFETGYRFESNERARVYLTNALEPPSDASQSQIDALSEALAHEAIAVNLVKHARQFTVVVGNPPYANYSANLSPLARRIVDKYRSFQGVPIRERNQLQFERNIQDDFVKFISIAQDVIASSGAGVIGYITNATMLASASLRGMRENLQAHCDAIFELNLHGGGNEIIADVKDDENVFDIVQSVAIHLFVRSKLGATAHINYTDLLGPRLAKYSWLSSHSVLTTEWQRIHPDPENHSFTPRDEATAETNRRLDSVFVKFGAGIKTNRDAVAIGFDESALVAAVRDFNPRLLTGKHSRASVKPILYRPFDAREIFYHEDVVASRSLPTMTHMIAGPNIGLVCSSTWTTPERFSVGISRLMVEMKTGTHDRGTTFFPLYRYESPLLGALEKVHNLSTAFVADWRRVSNTEFVLVGRGDGVNTTGPEDVLFWLYGLFHSPEYKRRYRAALSQGFPIVLLPPTLPLLNALTRLGGELIALHLLESPKLRQFKTEFVGDRNRKIEKLSYASNTIWIDRAQSTGFSGVRDDVQQFFIGGYPVCEKWLKDRKGRELSYEDIEHYQKIVVAIAETIRIMNEVDEVIAQHGGWPGAFQIAHSALS